MFKYSTAKTFMLVSELLEETEIDITEIYKKLYTRPYKEIKFQGYLSQNFKITPNGVGYIIVSEDTLEEYGVDAGTPGNMINNFNYIDEMKIWTTITYDKDLDTYRISIRSRGITINDVASKYGGGGHKNASGVRLNDPQKIQNLIKDLDDVAEQSK